MSLSDMSHDDIKTIRFSATCTRHETDEARLARQAQQIAEFEAIGGRVHVIPEGYCHESPKVIYEGCGRSSTSGAKAHE